MSARIKCDGEDRHVLRDKLSLSIDSLDPGQHSSCILVKRVAGVVVHFSVNIHDSVQIGLSYKKSHTCPTPEIWHYFIFNISYVSSIKGVKKDNTSTPIFDLPYLRKC